MVQQLQGGHTNAKSACSQGLKFKDSKSTQELEFLRPKQLRIEFLISICSLIDKYKHVTTTSQTAPGAGDFRSEPTEHNSPLNFMANAREE